MPIVTIDSLRLAGTRLATKVTPMQKLQVIVDQIVRQIKPQPDLADCKLLINGKQADLDLQYRFASLGPSSKLVLQTGMQLEPLENNHSWYIP